MSQWTTGRDAGVESPRRKQFPHAAKQSARRAGRDCSVVGGGVANRVGRARRPRERRRDSGERRRRRAAVLPGRRGDRRLPRLEDAILIRGDAGSRMRIDAQALRDEGREGAAGESIGERDRVDPPAGAAHARVGSEPPAELDRVPGDVRPEVHDRRHVSEGRPGPGRAAAERIAEARGQRRAVASRDEAPPDRGVGHVGKGAGADVRRRDLEDATVEEFIEVETIAEGQTRGSRLDGEGRRRQALVGHDALVVDEGGIGKRIGARCRRLPQRGSRGVRRGPAGRKGRSRHAVEALRERRDRSAERDFEGHGSGRRTVVRQRDRRLGRRSARSRRAQPERPADGTAAFRQLPEVLGIRQIDAAREIERSLDVARPGRAGVGEAEIHDDGLPRIDGVVGGEALLLAQGRARRDEDGNRREAEVRRERLPRGDRDGLRARGVTRGGRRHRVRPRSDSHRIGSGAAALAHVAVGRRDDGARQRRAPRRNRSRCPGSSRGTRPCTTGT